MDKEKVLKLSIIVLLIMLVICVLVIILYKEKKTEDFNDENPEESNILIDNSKIEENFNSYNNIKACINLMVVYARSNNKEAISEISGESYIFENQTIPDEGVVMLKPIHVVENEKGSANFIAFKIYKSQPTYYGILLRDYTTGAYKLVKSSKEEYNNAFQNKIDDKYLEYIPIELKAYNKYNYIVVKEPEEVNEYFKDFIQTALYYPEEAYNLLNETYRNSKYPTYQDFMAYLSKHKKEFESLDIYSMKDAKDFENDEAYNKYLTTLKKLSKYSVKKFGDSNQYSCIDDYGNLYIFKITGAMKYEVYLDDYTVPLQDFIQRYNSSTTEEKVTLNLNKFLKAINEGDYIYAYGKLSKGFKNNYFPTISEFKQYVNNSWIDYTKIKNVNVKAESEVYKCIVNTELGQSKQFVVQLMQGTDYLISFKVN